MKSIAFSILLSLAVLPALVLADTQVKDLQAEKYIFPDSVAMRFGRTIWMNNCETCHGYGIADAPVPMHAEDWKNRVTKDRATLYEHAIEGFIGPDYSMMPARGGNDELEDEQVKAAVDYMLFLANYYINEKTKR